MINAILFLVVTLVWGSTWIMYKFQLGVVPPEVSLVYRFVLVAGLMFIWALLRGQRIRFSLQEHLLMALQGGLLFSINFLFVYNSAFYLSTGLIAVIFSTASIMTLLFSALLLKTRPPFQVLLGAGLGAMGIVAIFWPELERFSLGSGAGLGLILAGTACFAVGSMVSARSQAAGLSMQASMPWCALYGSILLLCYMLATGKNFNFDPRIPYVASSLFLIIFSTLVGFYAYFRLLGRTSPERASYVTVLLPLVALSLSTMFEGYEWTGLAFLGVVLILAGNVLVMKRPRAGATGKQNGL